VRRDAHRVILEDGHEIAWFVSDVHLGGSPPEEEQVTRERFTGLLDRAAADGASLYILGDLFDFWFEYRTVLPKSAFGILSRLAALAEGPLPVRLLLGNHDYWLGEFLRRETRIEVIPDGVTVEIQGRRARLVHGDGLGPGDHGYKVLKRVLRHPLAVRAFRWIHPDIGIRMGLGGSDVSRKYTALANVDTERLYTHVALPAFGEGVDALLMGHHHVALHWTREPGEFLMMGDWFRQYTCVRLSGGRFQLLSWPLDDVPPRG
jgi:UDP-2,3-diacylglucosamine hydrolase